MIRSSSKLISRARSVRNMAKVPFKFRFDFIIETIENISAVGAVVVVLERSGKKQYHTPPSSIDRSARRANFQNERITVESTLFKTQPTEKKFQDKVIRLGVRVGSVEGKLLAKIHLNLAQYAEVPSGSRRISAELSNGSTLVATVQCQFLSIGKAAGLNRTRSQKSDTTDEDEEGFEEDAVDLDTTENHVRNGQLSLDSNDGTSRSRMKISSIMTRKSVTKRSMREDEAGATVKGETLSSRLRRENNELRKQLAELECNAANAQIREEHKAVKAEHEELKLRLAREPGYEEVTRQLKEVKMALAVLKASKEKCERELRQLINE